MDFGESSACDASSAAINYSSKINIYVVKMLFFVCYVWMLFI